MATMACQRCGSVDPSLRLTVFPWVVSVLIVSFKRASVGVYCTSCRAAVRWKYLGVSAGLGWWGLPWGVVWTLQALATCAGGGQQPKDENATLLALLGRDFAQSGNDNDARAAFRQSLGLNHDPSVERALIMLDAAPASTRFTDSVRPGDLVRLVRASEVLATPEAGSSVVSTALLGSTQVVLGRRAGWTHVRLSTGQTGWVRDSDVAKDS